MNKSSSSLNNINLNFKPNNKNIPLTSTNKNLLNFFDNKKNNKSSIKNPKEINNNNSRREKLKTLLLEKLAQKFNAFEYLEIIEKSVADILLKDQLNSEDLLELENRVKEIVLINKENKLKNKANENTKKKRKEFLLRSTNNIGKYLENIKRKNSSSNINSNLLINNNNILKQSNSVKSFKNFSNPYNFNSNNIKKNKNKKNLKKNKSKEDLCLNFNNMVNLGNNNTEINNNNNSKRERRIHTSCISRKDKNNFEDSQNQNIFRKNSFDNNVNNYDNEKDKENKKININRNLTKSMDIKYKLKNTIKKTNLYKLNLMEDNFGDQDQEENCNISNNKNSNKNLNLSFDDNNLKNLKNHKNNKKTRPMTTINFKQKNNRLNSEEKAEEQAAEQDALRSYEFRRFFMNERKEKQKDLIDKINTEYELNSKLDNWQNIINYKKDLHELEEKQNNDAIKYYKEKTRESYDNQNYEKALVKISNKLEEIKFNELMKEDIRKYEEEEKEKLQIIQNKKNEEKDIRLKQIISLKEETRKRIIEDIKENRDYSKFLFYYFIIIIL